MTVKKINLPSLPDEFLDDILKAIATEQDLAFRGENQVHYIEQVTWKAAPPCVQSWCRTHICDDIFWGLQTITADLPIHKDIDTLVKFYYLVQPGGDNVQTRYFKNGEQIASYHFNKGCWYIIDVETEHDAVGIEPGQVRIGLTGRIFPNT